MYFGFSATIIDNIITEQSHPPLKYTLHDRQLENINIKLYEYENSYLSQFASDFFQRNLFLQITSIKIITFITWKKRDILKHF